MVLEIELSELVKHAKDIALHFGRKQGNYRSNNKLHSKTKNLTSSNKGNFK